MKNYNIKNESFIVSYYLNNFSSVDYFQKELFQDETLSKIVHGLEIMKVEGLGFNLESLDIILAKEKMSIPIKDIKNLKESYSDFTNIEVHLGDLKTDYNKNVASVGLLKTFSTKVNSAGEVSSEEIVADLEQIITTLKKNDGIQFLSPKELMENMDKTLLDRANPDKQKSVGFKCIDDNVTRPGAAGEIHMMVSLRGTGKSAVKQTLENNLVVRGIPVVSFSIEMSELSTSDRQMAMKTGISMMDLNKKPMDVYNDPRYKRIRDEYSLVQNYLFTDEPDLSFDSIDLGLYKAREIFRKRGIFKDSEEYMYITIDVLNMVSDFGDQEPRTILKAMDRLHKLVKKHRVHCLGIGQINESKLRGGKIWRDPDELDHYRPNLEDIYGGSAYAQRARMVSILHRPKFLKERIFPHMLHIFEAEPDILGFHCVKQNDGGLFLNEFIFEGEKMRVRPFVRDYEE